MNEILTCTIRPDDSFKNRTCLLVQKKGDVSNGAELAQNALAELK